MKKLSIIIVAILFLGANNIAFAHPGRTDANGGHACWTNCTKWGFEYREYHYHAKKIKETPKVKIEARQTAKSSK